MGEMRYTAKDSVFSYIFRHPENLLKLYQTLHPEDTEATEADCHLVTLEHVLTNGIINDLGLRVRDMLIILVEAQTKFTINIVLRVLLYLAETYKEYVEEKKLDLYGSRAIRIPRPELYMVYTGAPRQLPEVIRLSDMYEGKGSVEVEVKVLQNQGGRSIVDQYIRFCEISDEQRRKYGYTAEAVEETLRICIAENILMPFLASREKEVHDIMVTLFDQERVAQIHDYNVARDAREEGRKEGREEGRKAGLETGIRAIVLTLRGLSSGKATAIQTLIDQFGLLPQTAAEKVEQYWDS